MQSRMRMKFTLHHHLFFSYHFPWFQSFQELQGFSEHGAVTPWTRKQPSQGYYTDQDAPEYSSVSVHPRLRHMTAHSLSGSWPVSIGRGGLTRRVRTPVVACAPFWLFLHG